MKLRILFFSLLVAFTLPDFSYSAPADSDRITMFPNPVTEGQVTIKSNSELVKVQILSIVGQTVFMETLEPSNEVRLYLDLPSGLYLLKVFFTDHTSDTKRIWIK